MVFPFFIADAGTGESIIFETDLLPFHIVALTKPKHKANCVVTGHSLTNLRSCLIPICASASSVVN